MVGDKESLAGVGFSHDVTLEGSWLKPSWLYYWYLRYNYNHALQGVEAELTLKLLVNQIVWKKHYRKLLNWQAVRF